MCLWHIDSSAYHMSPRSWDRPQRNRAFTKGQMVISHNIYTKRNWTVILMKAAVVAETSTNLIKGCNLMNL